MIVRIVKMTFRSEEIETFELLFNERKALIRHFDGCQHLELWQDASQSNIFFTYSIWENEGQLDRYRFSDLFKDTWSRTKALFSEKPQAWSVMQKVVVE